MLLKITRCVCMLTFAKKENTNYPCITYGMKVQVVHCTHLRHGSPPRRICLQLSGTQHPCGFCCFVCTCVRPWVRACVHMHVCTITYLLLFHSLQDIALISAGNVLYKSGYISDAIVCFSLAMEVCASVHLYV